MNLRGTKLISTATVASAKKLFFRVFLETLDAQALMAMTMVFYVMVKLEILKSGI